MSDHYDRKLSKQNNWEMFHWDISVAFTNAKAEEETYVRFLKSIPSDFFSVFKGGTIALLKRNLYGTQTFGIIVYISV